MTQAVMPATAPADVRSPDRRAGWCVHFFQILFLLVLLPQLDAPFLSAHNERQNQTFDMSRHIFRDGWASVITPKVSYSGWGYETQPFTAALQEFPFHGVIGWPLAQITSHERALTRLISAAFAVLSIQLMFWILRFWLPPAAAAAGAGLWAMAPLVLHFGQVPMPDIVCTAGILLAFWFALRGNLAAASAGFLFALLAKLSMIVYGLPVLVALLVARNCGSTRDFLRIAILWGWLPLSGILLWNFILYHFAPPTHMTVMGIMQDRGDWISMVRLSFYKFVIGCLVPFGVGVIGVLGLIFAAHGKSRMDQRIKWAIIGSNLFFLVFVIRKVPEPQYLVPMLAWCVIPAAFGFEFLIEKWRSGMWRTGLAAVLLLHLAVAVFFTVDLKASRVPNYTDIEKAATLLPADARVLVLYRFYGASPAVWLDRNVLAVGIDDPKLFPNACDKARRSGFTHLLILDIESWHDEKTKAGPLEMIGRVFHLSRKKPIGGAATDYSSPGSPFRQYCDHTFSLMFDAPRVVLYAMPK